MPSSPIGMLGMEQAKAYQKLILDELERAANKNHPRTPQMIPEKEVEQAKMPKWIPVLLVIVSFVILIDLVSKMSASPDARFAFAATFIIVLLIFTAIMTGLIISGVRKRSMRIYMQQLNSRMPAQPVTNTDVSSESVFLAQERNIVLENGYEVLQSTLIDANVTQTPIEETQSIVNIPMRRAIIYQSVLRKPVSMR